MSLRALEGFGFTAPICGDKGAVVDYLESRTFTRTGSYPVIRNALRGVLNLERLCSSAALDGCRSASPPAPVPHPDFRLCFDVADPGGMSPVNRD